MATTKSFPSAAFLHVFFILAMFVSMLADIAAGDYTTCPSGSGYRQQLVGTGIRCGPATCPDRCRTLCGRLQVRKTHCQENNGKGILFNIKTVFCACCCGASPSPPPPPRRSPPPPRRSPPPPRRSPPPPRRSPPPPRRSPPPPRASPPPPSPPPPSPPPPPPPSPPPPSPPPPPPPSPPPPSPPPPPPSDPRDLCGPGETSLSTVVTACSLCPACDCGVGVNPALEACISNYCNCCCPTTLTSSSTTPGSSLFAAA